MNCGSLFSVSSFCLVTCCVCLASAQDVPLGCGGFLKANFEVDFTRVQVKLFSASGSLKYTTDCAPNNGYFLVPLYDRGEFRLRIEAPTGWLIEPEEVSLKVDGETDQCSRAEDINFEIVGFSIYGQVVSGGGVDGPRGVTVKLFDNERLIQEIVTADEGRFSFHGIVPGIYQLQASHSVWDVTKDTLSVSVTRDSVHAPSGLAVHGYDVRGGVHSGREAVEGVQLILFTAKEIKCNGVKREELPQSVISRLAGGSPDSVCATSSDTSGHFVFPSLPPGDYLLVPYYRQETIEFEVQPTEIAFTVQNDTVDITPLFEVQGFSVSGRVLITREGEGVANAKVYVDGNLVATTNEAGNYRLVNITTNTYKIQVEAAELLFSSVDVSISPSSPVLPDILPSKYPVCGDVTMTLQPAESITVSSREIQVLTTGSRKPLASSRTDESGRFCVMLPLGEYIIKVSVSEIESQLGLVILPREQVVAMLETPTKNKLHFKQFLATLSGTVQCLESCPEAIVRLQRNGKRKKGVQSLSTKVNPKGRKGSFTFSDVLPGHVKVTLDYVEWCWSQDSVAVEITTGKLTPLTFNHTGYTLSYSVPHDTLVSYSVGNESAVDVIFSGRGHICVSIPGTYQIISKSCHKFEKTMYSYSTSSPKLVLMKTVGHTVTASVLSSKKDKQISLLIKSLRFGSEEQIVKPTDISESGSETWKYTFSFIAKVGDEVEVLPQCADLMFIPNSRRMTVSDECPEEVPSFDGNPGLIVVGHIQPQLEGVAIVVSIEGEVTVTRTSTDSSGRYRVGPFQSGKQISVRAELDGYVFEQLSDDIYSFKALKLSGITVKIVDFEGSTLPGVLVSLSGENFRSNNFTNDLYDRLEYNQLNPGQYYIKPLLREFEFSPSSKVVDLNQGESVEIVFVGSRVAFSCSGRVTTLNRLPVSGLIVEAVGGGERDGCDSYSEEANSDSDGSYRIRGLMPGCQYTLIVQTTSKPDIKSVLPSSKILELSSEDVENVNFIVFYKPSNIYITGNVITEESLLKSLKAQLLYDGKLVHSAQLDSAGFFDFSPIQVDPEKNYLVVLEPNLSPHLYKFSEAQQMVQGDHDSHVTFRFTAEEVQSEHESQRGSVVALVIAIVVIFVSINIEKVYSWIQNGGGRIDVGASSSSESLIRKKTGRRK